jgi:hypothetical protein
MFNNVIFLVLNYNFYIILKFEKDITEKVRLVVLHGLATIDGTDSSDSDANAKLAQQGGDNTDKPGRAGNGSTYNRLVKTWDIGENRTQDIKESR